MIEYMHLFLWWYSISTALVLWEYRYGQNKNKRTYAWKHFAYILLLSWILLLPATIYALYMIVRGKVDKK